jgi:hypothetical protein
MLHRYAENQALLATSDAQLALKPQLQQATGAAGRSQKQHMRELEQQVCTSTTWGLGG